MMPGNTGITYATLGNFLSGADESLGTFSFNGATSGNFTYSLNLTPSFSADILSGGLVGLRPFAADNSVSYLFDSRSFGTVSARPLLTISVVPEPGTLSLSLLGLSLFALRRPLRRNPHE